jgi:hypothetical protein
MEANQQETVVTSSPPPSTRILKTRIPATAAFLIALVLFLLPFAEVRCNGTAMANNTGLGIAMGSEWKEVVTKNVFGQSVDTGENKREFNQKQDPNMFAIAALALGLIGLFIALMHFKGGGRINLYIAILAVVSLIAMLIDLKSKAKSDTSVRSSDVDLNVGVKITVDGTAWLYVTVILFFAAAFFSWQRNRLET